MATTGWPDDFPELSRHGSSMDERDLRLPPLRHIKHLEHKHYVLGKTREPEIFPLTPWMATASEGVDNLLDFPQMSMVFPQMSIRLP
jgi:hypothetical protein